MHPAAGHRDRGKGGNQGEGENEEARRSDRGTPSVEHAGERLAPSNASVSVNDERSYENRIRGGTSAAEDVNERKYFASKRGCHLQGPGRKKGDWHKMALRHFLLSLGLSIVLGCGSADPRAEEGGPANEVVGVAAEPVTVGHGQRGEERLVLILSRFSMQGDSDAQMRQSASAFLANLDAFVRETSYGRQWLNWQVVGPYLLSSEGCDNNDWTYATNHDKVRHDAVAAADPDVDFSVVGSIVFMTSDYFICQTAASGNEAQDRGLVSAEGPVITRIVHIPYWRWRPQTSPTDFTLPHEFGHALGGDHIDALDCRSKYGTRVTIAHSSSEGHCDVASYYFHEIGCDVMNNTFAHFTALHKEHFGWLDPPEHAVSTVGTFFLSPLETPGGLKLLRIPFSNPSEFGGYAIEYRRPVGADSNLPSHGVPLDGVFLTVYPTWAPWMAYVPNLAPEVASDTIRLHALPLSKKDAFGRDVPSYVDATQRLAVLLRSADASGALVELQNYDPNRTGPICGSVTCLAGQVCCNESCSICAPPNGACTQQICNDQTE
jgi:hypothetical protein